MMKDDWPLDKIETQHAITDLVLRQHAITDLVLGIAAMLFSTILGTVIALTVIMTPDPSGLIHYGGISIILLVLFGVFIYALTKLYKVEKFLKS